MTQNNKILAKKYQIFKVYLEELLPQYNIIRNSENHIIYGKFVDIPQTCLDEIYATNIKFIDKTSQDNKINFCYISCSIKEIYKGLSIIAQIIDNFNTL